MAANSLLVSARRIALLWPLWIGIALLLLSTAYLQRLSLARTQGHLIYPLDDTYMHLTLARNLAIYGQLGFSRHDFVFASSSPLFTVLLATTFRAVGVNVATPILLNLFFAVLLLCVSYFLFRKWGVPKALALLSLTALIVLPPLPLMILSGMEHVMQAFFAIVCLGLITAVWDDRVVSAPRQLALGTAAFLATATRYESIFLLSAACSLLWLSGRVRAGLLLLIGMVLGIGLPGIFSVLQGGTFLPVSVLLKGNLPAPTISGLLTFANRSLNTAMENSYLVLLLAAILIGCYCAQQARGTFWNRSTATGVIWITACLLHLVFARMGWVYRYEAYMIAGSCFLLTVNPEFILRAQMALQSGLWLYPVALSVLLIIPFVGRTKGAWRIYPTATANIYEQQYQMARFLERNYSSGRVALNDIGAVSFYSDVKIFDIFGLASPEVARAKMAGLFDKARLSQLSEAAGSQIAIAYEHWDFEMPGGLPAAWKKVGSWTIANNAVCGSSTVFFFAAHPEEVPRLRSALVEFESELPESVTQEVLPRANAF